MVRLSRLSAKRLGGAILFAGIAGLGLVGCAGGPEHSGNEAGAEVAPKVEPGKEKKEAAEAKPQRSVPHVILLYVPNRLLDVMDIARLRLRVGPGVAAGVRATEVAEVYVGTYASLYAGLPGPRKRPSPKLPLGFESLNGASVSVADATVDGGIGPDYSGTEFGVSVHPVVIGLDIGLDPWEVVDLLTGLVEIDVRRDSL